jgi:hypothetical protein
MPPTTFCRWPFRASVLKTYAPNENRLAPPVGATCASSLTKKPPDGRYFRISSFDVSHNPRVNKAAVGSQGVSLPPCRRSGVLGPWFPAFRACRPFARALALRRLRALLGTYRLVRLVPHPHHHATTGT